MNGNPLLEQYLSQQFGDNPQMQAMLSMMRQRQAESADIETIEPEPAGQENELRLELEKAHDKVDQLRRKICRLQDRLEAMESFEEELAHALGACIYCWGEEPGCRTCLGRGKPGSMEPDPALFNRWIAPALRRLRPIQENKN